MRITGYTDKSGLKQNVFTSLVQECQLSAPGSRLSDNIRRKIEEFEKEDRIDVVSKTMDGCAPLFLACKNGSAEVAEYLITRCNADMEQKGLYEVAEEGVSHSVTPLWCAAVSGRLSVVKVLLKYNADVNSVSDTGSTPLRSACYIVRPGLQTSHMEIIKALVEASADVQKPNHYGGTCLINSVQSPTLCRYLLEYGAFVDADDVQRKTALHYAVQEGRLETVKILMEYGADPWKVTKYGDDAFQTACIKGALLVFNYLIEKINTSTVMILPKVCNMFELLGATFLLDMQDMGTAIFLWRKAADIRNNGDVPVPKHYLGFHPVLGVQEFCTRGELDVFSADVHQLKLQALVITERILGSDHKDTIFRYMYAGAGHADNGEFKDCIVLWNYALELKIQKETLLSSDTAFTIRAVIQLYINMFIKEDNQNQRELEFKDVANTTKCIKAGLKLGMELTRVIPKFMTQLENWDMVLNSWLHLVYLLLRLAKSPEEKGEVYRLVQHAKSVGVKSSSGDSLLHMAVSSHLSIRSGSSETDSKEINLFPNANVVNYLIYCGYDIHERNESKQTPLHVAAYKANYKEKVLTALLSRGSHVDLPDSRGITALDIMRTHAIKANVMQNISLKCLSANVINREKLLPETDLHKYLPVPCVEFCKKHI